MVLLELIVVLSELRGFWMCYLQPPKTHSSKGETAAAASFLGVLVPCKQSDSAFSRQRTNTVAATAAAATHAKGETAAAATHAKAGHGCSGWWPLSGVLAWVNHHHAVTDKCLPSLGCVIVSGRGASPLQIRRM
jgi:hypothetical protein